MNRSLSSSEKKIVITIPGTPKDHWGGLFNHSQIKAQNLSRSPKYNKSNPPRPHRSMINNPASSSEIHISQKFAYNTDKIFRDPKRLTKRIEERKKRIIAEMNCFSITPTNTDKRKKLKARVLSRRPQHMSFRNMHKSESSWIKPIALTPSKCNYEFSGNMLLNAIAHTHKPVKFRLLSKRDYIPAASKRNI